MSQFNCAHLLGTAKDDPLDHLLLDLMIYFIHLCDIETN